MPSNLLYNLSILYVLKINNPSPCIRILDIYGQWVLGVLIIYEFKQPKEEYAQSKTKNLPNTQEPSQITLC